jgi:hypothetical protein
VLLELWHCLKFLERQRQEEALSGVLPVREVEQEVLDTIDTHGPWHGESDSSAD